MSYKIDGVELSAQDIKDAMVNSEECINNLYNKDPYKTQLLIAKYILR